MRSRTELGPTQVRRSLAMICRHVDMTDDCHACIVATMGSLPEGQKFFRSEAKLNDLFWDHGSARLMAAGGWNVERRLLVSDEGCNP